MSWARYDDELTLNYKYGRLRAMGVNGMAALGLHLAANTYARHNGTGGVIEPHVPELLAGKCGPRLAEILTDVGMFDAVPGGAWLIHDFAEFHDPNDPDPNRSASDRKKEISEKRAAAGRLGGQANGKQNGSKTPRLLEAKQVANPWQTPSPDPDPSTSDSKYSRSSREAA